MYDTAKTPMDRPVMLQKALRQHGLPVITTLFAIVTVLFVASSGAFLFYATISHPAELNAQATAVVRTIATGQAQATATNSPQYIYAQVTGQPPSYSFSLGNQEAGQAQGWFTNNTSNSSCIFTGGAYHLRGVGNQTYVFCQNTVLSNLDNFALQVQMMILSGFTGGITVRSPYQSEAGYAFGFTSNGLYYVDITGDNVASIRSFGRANINLGIGETNLLTAIAQGSHISFYVNKQFVAAIDDGTYPSGAVSFSMSNLGNHAAGDVAFRNVQIWQL